MCRLVVLRFLCRRHGHCALRYLSTIVFGLFAFAWPMAAVAQTLPRSVLILDQSDNDSTWYNDFSSAFRFVMRTKSSTRISTYGEHLDLSRFGDARHEELLRTYLHDKFRDRPIGVVVAQGSKALEFALRARPQLWPGIPIVFASVDEA